MGHWPTWQIQDIVEKANTIFHNEQRAHYFKTFFLDHCTRQKN